MALCQLSLINGSRSVLDKMAMSEAQFSDRMSCFRHSMNDGSWRIPVDRVAIAKLRLSRPADPRRGLIALLLKEILITLGQS